jgi:hypothetical protein
MLWSRANTIAMVTRHLFVTNDSCLTARPYSLILRFENEIWLTFDSIRSSKFNFSLAL